MRKHASAALFVALLSASGCSQDTPQTIVLPDSGQYFERHLVTDSAPGGIDCCSDVLATGDIDGDGFPDVVVGSENDEAQGLAWYAYPTWSRHDIGAGQFTTDGDVADLDGDGDLDIVVGDTSRGLIWAENQDAGTNWALHTLLANQYVHDLAVADIDGDGHSDVVITDKKALRLLRLRDTAVVDVAVLLDHPGEGLAIHDLDGDGDLDVLFSNLWLEQERADGQTRWNPRDIAPHWTRDTRVAAHDVDGDGTLDVVLTGSEGDSAVAWFARSATAGTWIEHRISQEPLNGAHSLAVLDVDGDGRPDVVTAEMHTAPQRRVLAYLQRDSGWQAVTLALHGSHNMAAADVDGDGDTDLLGKNYGGRGRFVEYWENRSADLALAPTAAPRAPTHWRYIALSATRPESDRQKFGLVLADVNGDARTDVLAGGTLYLAPPPPLAAEWPAQTVVAAGDALHVVDRPGGGLRQLLFVDDSSLLLASAPTKDDSGWTTKVLAPLPPGRTQGAAISRNSADGRYDLLFTRGTTLQALTIDPAAPPESWPLRQVRADVEESGVAVADLDGDADLDVVTVAASGRQLLLLETTPNGTRERHVGASLHWIDRVAVADLDGDGRRDIIYTEETRDHRHNARVAWLKAPPDPWIGHWKPTGIVTLRSANSLGVTDIDGDGDVDVVVAEHTDLRPGDAIADNFTGVFLNRGDGTFVEEPVEVGTHSSHLGAQTADLDGDGIAEIVSIGWEQSCCIHVWRRER